MLSNRLKFISQSSSYSNNDGVQTLTLGPFIPQTLLTPIEISTDNINPRCVNATDPNDLLNLIYNQYQSSNSGGVKNQRILGIYTDVPQFDYSMGADPSKICNCVIILVSGADDSPTTITGLHDTSTLISDMTKGNYITMLCAGLKMKSVSSKPIAVYSTTNFESVKMIPAPGILSPSLRMKCTSGDIHPNRKRDIEIIIVVLVIFFVIFILFM
jgi:hypothetical protein